MGGKEVLLGCITLSIAGAVGCALASDYLTFLLFRTVQAMGCGFFVLGHALVEDLFEEQDPITTITLLIPMLISALAVTLVRPAAISAAMLLFSSSAGTAASAGNSIMFLTAAVSSAALAQTGSHFFMTIAISFIGFSLWGLLTNRRIGRR